jgi:tRNA-binding protein
MATYEDFEKLDIRVGKIIDVKDFPEAKKPAYKLVIDFGKIGIKMSSAQITALYAKEDLLGKQVIAIINFPPKKIADFISEVLVLGILNKDKVVLLKPEREVELGDRIA